MGTTVIYVYHVNLNTTCGESDCKFCKARRGLNGSQIYKQKIYGGFWPIYLHKYILLGFLWKFRPLSIE